MSVKTDGKNKLSCPFPDPPSWIRIMRFAVLERWEL
jgi:hypothetical protein